MSIQAIKVVHSQLVVLEVLTTRKLIAASAAYKYKKLQICRHHVKLTHSATKLY